MTVERVVRIFAGSFVLNLFQSGFTGLCPLEIILNKLRVPCAVQERA